MKDLLIRAAVVSLVAASCGGNGNGVAAITTTAASPASSGDDQFEGKASLTYTIDGKKTAIRDYKITGPHQRTLALYINKAVDDPATGTAEVRITNVLTSDFFEFKIADKGVTQIVHYRPGLTSSKTSADFLDYHTATNFYADNVTVTITSLDASHIAGTFAGTYKTDDGKPATLTDGSFDVPMKKEQ